MGLKKEHKDLINDLPLDDVVACLIEENCIGPIVEAIVEHVTAKLNKLETIQETLIKLVEK